VGEAEKTRAGSHNPGQVRGFDAQEDLEELQEIVGQALSPIVLPEAFVDDGRPITKTSLARSGMLYSRRWRLAPTWP
jgi:hypothetical protein